jgi:WD40 repeat protein
LILENKTDKWLKAKKSRASIDGLNDMPIPSACTFLNSESNQLVCGFNDSYISLYDLTKNTFTSNIKTLKLEKNEKQAFRNSHQPNTLISSYSLPIIYGGFEDNSIKTIDLRTDSVTNSFNAHSDSVTSLNLFNDIYLFSTSHDTKIKLWDIRNLGTPIQEAFGSQKKWDEAMWHSILIQNQMVLATGKNSFIYNTFIGGADSAIKLFKL